MVANTHRRRQGVGPFGVQPFKAQLRQLGITQASAASVVNRYPSLVSLMGNGWVVPTLPVAVGLARLLHRPVEECFTEELMSATGGRAE